MGTCQDKNTKDITGVVKTGNNKSKAFDVANQIDKTSKQLDVLEKQAIRVNDGIDKLYNENVQLRQENKELGILLSKYKEEKRGYAFTDVQSPLEMSPKLSRETSQNITTQNINADETKDTCIYIETELMRLTALKRQYDDKLPLSVPKYTDQTFEFKHALCIDVHDGDTISIIAIFHGQPTEFRIRIFGIDAPEISSKDETELLLAKKAQKIVSDMLLGKIIDVDIVTNKKITKKVGGKIRHEKGRDPYGRLSGYVSINGKDVAKTLLEAGLAHEYYGVNKDKIAWH